VQEIPPRLLQQLWQRLPKKFLWGMEAGLRTDDLFNHPEEANRRLISK